MKKINSDRMLPIRDVVYQSIRKAILRGDYPAGERLMEEQLAHTLGTSRTPVREALRKLEVEKIVKHSPNKGVVVSEINPGLKPGLDNEKYVTLEVMLAAREARAVKQGELLAEHSCAVISYMLNIAGPVKRFPLGDQCFYEGKKEIEKQLARLGFAGDNSLSCQPYLTDAETGLECLWVVDADALKLKSEMAAIEEYSQLGRLFDIDVISKKGEKISRGDVGLPERQCLICSEPGAGCARNRTHPLEEIQRAAHSIIENYFRRKDAQVIAKNAVRALLYEISATPKPGLVDRRDSGAHSDMDFFTYIDSTSALAAYFEDMAERGAVSRGFPPEGLLPRLRQRGIVAEEEMFAATGGINTHKGLIFSMGIICAAFGWHGSPFPDSDTVLQTAAKIAAPALYKDLEGVTPQNAATKGEAAFAKHGLSGIRGEAAGAFPAVRVWGLPVLKNAAANSKSLNDAGVEALLHLISNVVDTNIIGRSNKEILKTLQDNLRAFLSASPDNTAILEHSARLNELFIKDNISPGGCADLLAVTYIMYFMELEKTGLK